MCTTASRTASTGMVQSPHSIRSPKSRKGARREVAQLRESLGAPFSLVVAFTQHVRIGFSVFTAFIDELNKYIVIIAYAYRRREFDEPQAGIFVTMLIALGFVTGDNAWHIIQADKYADTWRILSSIPMSMLVGVLMGFYSGMSKYGLDSDDLSSFGLRIRGLVTATLFHGFYNFFLFMEEYNSLMTLIVIGALIVLLQVGLCIFRARRLHSRLVYSRMRRTKSGSGDI